eukprot:CAMPEP_0203757572 /NCGR_PEP_ID=MMETSP0098-20131031/10573_1 /ASSEMBLY_ACC=CAM_ASM_000208 /TAXON_ID=96639 /ORGANISM=" , Strain NY0313808BC1" /LENGTH=911 /DNA_ID=CAMNT_0050649793 /DNA_START=166 /DNA_END=2898 /DNA_ORIENTATION=-
MSENGRWRAACDRTPLKTGERPPRSPASGEGRLGSLIGEKRGHKFSFSKSLRASSGNAALRLERSKWNAWIKSIRQGTARSCDIYGQVKATCLTFPSSVISRRDCGTMVALLIELNPDVYVSRLITYFYQKKHVEFESKDIVSVVKFLVEQVENAETSFDALEALSFVLFNVGARCGGVIDLLVETLVTGSLLRDKTADVRNKSMCYTCIGNLLQRKVLGAESVKGLIDISVQTLEGCMQFTPGPSNAGLQENSKLLHSVLRVLHGTCLAFGCVYFQSCISDLLRKVSVLIGYNAGCLDMKGSSTSQTSSLLSESEMSDSESEQKASSSRLRKQNEKIRLAALMILESFCKDGKVAQGHWDYFLPQRDGCNVSPRTPNLLSISLYDAHPKIRAAGLSTIAALIEGSPLRIWLSQRRPKKPAFVPLSVKIAKMTEEIHKMLALSFEKEKNPTALAQLLTCTGSLFHSVPYEMEDNLYMLNELLKGPLLNVVLDKSRQGNVREMAIGCISNMLHTKARLLPVQEWVYSSYLPRLYDGSAVDHPRLLLTCVSPVFGFYSQQIVDLGLWLETRGVLLNGFASRDSRYRYDSMGLVEEVLKADKARGGDLTPQLDGLDVIISTHLPRALKDIDSDVRAKAASCIAQITTNVWETCPEEQRWECVKSILDSANASSAPNVRDSALTALGSMALIKAFVQGGEFVQNVVPSLLISFQDESVNIRMRSSVTIANMLHTRREDSPLDPNIHRQLLSSCLTHCDDHDKVAASSIRALGYLISTHENQNVVKQIEHKLADTIQRVDASAKIRWSACNAAAHAFSNGLMLKDGTLLESLCKAVSCDNFKVRIAAVSALAVSPAFEEEQRQVAETIIRVLEDAFMELTASDRNVDMAQLKFCDKLVSLLKESLIHCSSVSGILI